MSKQWKFQGDRRGRKVQTFDEFANSPFAADAFNAIEKTHLGNSIIMRLGYERDQINTLVRKSVSKTIPCASNCYGILAPALKAYLKQQRK